jgi:hypothetical protein
MRRFGGADERAYVLMPLHLHADMDLHSTGNTAGRFDILQTSVNMLWTPLLSVSLLLNR